MTKKTENKTKDIEPVQRRATPAPVKGGLVVDGVPVKPATDNKNPSKEISNAEK